MVYEKMYLEVDEERRTAVYRGFANRKISHCDHVTHSFFLASHHEHVLPSPVQILLYSLAHFFSMSGKVMISGNAMVHAGTTASSTDSGQGSEPLSDAFVAVTTETDMGRGS